LNRSMAPFRKFDTRKKLASGATSTAPGMARAPGAASIVSTRGTGERHPALHWRLGHWRSGKPSPLQCPDASGRTASTASTTQPMPRKEGTEQCDRGSSPAAAEERL
jgi:hypothetical protein